ncbi:hypothetical protein F4777DRAFT_558875 [Nemania sp. FL0916]|nr:hypothetical protein F4777DRAFT_558875 [Nemania sp. FL0916]
MVSFKKLFRRTTAPVIHPQGLEVVHEDPQAILDIVAVHGLNGHREKTWTAANGVHWLRDLLPQNLPGLRVMTWGYDANTHSSRQVNFQYMFQHAEQLVSELTARRKLTQSFHRPIIFIGHSLGGLVVKSALIHSDARRQGALGEHRSIKISTYGVLYIGTPHQGSDAVPLGRVFADIASIFIKTNDRILKNLERDSEWLQQQLSHYKSISGDFVTKFAYETYPTRIALGKSILVVPSASAVVPGDADAEPIAITADHTNMVKFNGNTDAGYIRISETLQIMAPTAVGVIQSRWEEEERVNEARDNPDRFTLPLDLSRVTEVPRFVSREKELSQMDAILRKTGERRTVILHGLGGMGKTQLTREYIRRHRTHFSAALWLNANDTASLRLSFERVAQSILRYYPSVAYIVNAVQKQDLDECVEAVKRWLDEPKNDSWVIVYDNYDNPKLGSTKPITTRDEKLGDTALAAEASKTNPEEDLMAQQAYDIRPFLPNIYHGAVIITTRSSQIKLGECIRITKLTELKDSIEILASTSRREGLDEDADASRLVQRLDGLPLALATAGAYLEGVPSTSLAQYLEMYEQSWVQLQQNSPQIISYEDRAMYSTWNISYLHIKGINPASAKLLHLWAYFDNEDLWYELLSDWASWESNDDGAQTIQLLKEIASNNLAFDAAIRVLHDYGLVDLATSTSNRWESQGYSMHDCVHTWTQYVVNAKADKIAETSMARLATECVAAHIPTDRHAEYWIIQRRLLKHADRCWARFKGGIELGKEYGWLYEQLGYLYNDQDQFLKAEEMYGRALHGYEKIFGPNHPSTLKSVNALGVVYMGQGQYAEAEEMYERALKGREKELGPDSPSTLETVNNLGNVYNVQGQYVKAEEMYERALHGYEKALGPNHPSMLLTVHNLGNVYYKQGLYAEAEEMYERALKGREKELGPDSPFTLQTINNLGNVYCKQGQYAEAKKLYERALHGHEKAWEAESMLDHTEVLNTLENLGMLSYELGKKEKAREYYLRARAGCGEFESPSSERYLRLSSKIEWCSTKLSDNN